MTKKIEEVMNNYQASQDRIDTHWEKNAGNVESLQRLAINSEIKSHHEAMRALHEFNLQHNEIRLGRQKQNVIDITSSWSSWASTGLAAVGTVSHVVAAYNGWNSIGLVGDAAKPFEDAIKTAQSFAGGARELKELTGTYQQSTLKEHDLELQNYDQTYGQNNSAKDRANQKKEEQLRELSGLTTKEHQDKAAMLRT